MNKNSGRRISRIVTVLALAVAVVTALGIPGGYFLTAYHYESVRLTRSAEVAADRFSEFIYLHPTSWPYQDGRLLDMLHQLADRNTPVRRRLIGIDHELLLALGETTTREPSLTRSAEVTDGEKVVARVEVAESLRPLMEETMKVAVGSFLFAICCFVSFLLLPMRALNRALDQLNASERALRAENQAKELALKKARELGESMRHLALHDQLTGLPNRTLFLDRLNQAFLLASRNQESMAVLVMDLDDFKQVNDTLGHHIGDRLLQEVGKRIQSGLRKSDTVARLGGDEFALIFPGTDKTGALLVAERICKRLEMPTIYKGGRRLSARASCGIAVMPEDGEQPALLLQRADAAMYQAKRSQRRVALYSPRFELSKAN